MRILDQFRFCDCRLRGRRCVVACIALSVLLTLAPLDNGTSAPPSSRTSDTHAGGPAKAPHSELTSKTRRSIERGLAWLAQQQKADGSFGSGSQYGRHVGITALAGLAFMSNGDMPGRGRYAQQVEQALKFVLESTADESGLICAETSYGPMYGHGFA